jgi:hypothetical protein
MVAGTRLAEEEPVVPVVYITVHGLMHWPLSVSRRCVHEHPVGILET